MNFSKPKDIVLTDDEGNTIERLELSIGEVGRLIIENMSKDELSKTFCLQFIDPYGDTIFNLLQNGFLKKEFEKLLSKCEIKEDQEGLQSVINFITKAEKDYVFVKFIGD